MKKFYTTLALACAVGASAFAATPVAEKKALTTFGELQYLSSDITLSRKANKAPQKVAAAVEDIEGYYAIDYEYVLSGNKTNGTCTIEQVSDDQIVMIFEPWCSQYGNIKMNPINAAYDASTGVITLKREENTKLGTYKDSQTGQTMTINLDIEEIVPIPNDPEGKYQLSPIDEITGVVNEDGTIQFGDENSGFGFQVEGGGWVGMFINLKLVAPDYFNFVASEWDSVGEVLFTEDWLNRWLTGDDAQYKLQARNIPLYKNKADNKLFAVENPFKVTGWVNEDPNTDGFLVFSLEDKDLIPMRPLTASGLWMTIEEGGFPQQWYVYNQEGLFIYDREYDYETAKQIFSESDITPSKYDASTKTVTLYNLCFGYTDDPGASAYYKDIADGCYKLQSDAFAPAGAVNDILDNSDNAPKRFFNLQGVEVSNPEAGQIVIVKQGNKAYKTIAK